MPRWIIGEAADRGPSPPRSLSSRTSARFANRNHIRYRARRQVQGICRTKDKSSKPYPLLPLEHARPSGVAARWSGTHPLMMADSIRAELHSSIRRGKTLSLALSTSGVLAI